MPDTPSFQDLLADFSEEIFVGRSEQLALFEQALTAPRPPFLILDVSGQGGVGKTTLLEQFRHLAKRRDVLTALVNEDHTSIPVVLSTFAKQFNEAGQPCKTFDERYKKCRELKDQVEADPKAPSGMLDFALRSVTRIGFRAIKKRVPLAEEASDVLLSSDAEDMLVEQTSAFANYVAQKFSSKDERVLLLETDAELTRHLLTDLNKQAENGRIVLFFDTFEKTASTLENWLIELLSGKFGIFSGNVLFVIAGRYPLGQSWMKFKRAIRQVELQEFTEAEARDYLARSGISDEKQIASLIQLSNRLPVLLALLISAPGEVPADVSSDAVERFLQGTTPEQREAALVASVPRFFNQDILAVILGPEKAESAFEWLSEAHFVRSSERGWVYHDVVRSLTLRYFRLRSTQRCAEIHGKLAEYYQPRAEGSRLAESKQRDNGAWRVYVREHEYHCLSKDPLSGLHEVLTGLLVEYEGPRSNRQEYAHTFAQVADETGDPELRIWAVRLHHLTTPIDKNTSPNGLKEYILAASALCDFTTLANQHRSHAFSIRGRFYAKIKDYSNALSDLSKAIELQPEDGDNYFWRGRIQYDAKDNLAALTDFSKAIELQPQDSYNYYWRGRVYREVRDALAALADFSKAIELQPEAGHNYSARGETYHDLKDYLPALTEYSKAIELEPQNSYSYYWRGHVHRGMKNYSAALADLTRAIELSPQHSSYYNGRGIIYDDIGEHFAALADYTRASELDPANSLPVYNIACSYALQNETERACNWLQRSIRLDEECVDWARTDSDFDSIRDTPEFKALMAEFGGEENLSTDSGN